MITVTKTYTRPNTEVKWSRDALSATNNFTDYRKTNYVNTKKLESVQVFESPDKLTLTYIFKWAAPNFYEEYKNDPAVKLYTADRDEYNQSVGIVSTEPVVVTG